MQISEETADFERIGKNWYVTVGCYEITVNAHSYTVITAHRLVNSLNTVLAKGVSAPELSSG